MNRRSHLPPFVATLLLGAFAQALLAAEPPAGLSLRGRGGPWLLLDDARGAAPAAAATGAPSVAGEPRTLAAGDLDRDGMPDLAVGLATPQGGRIVIYPGNLDHLFPNQPEAKARRAGGLGVDEPFLAAATVVQLDRAPDFLAIGDFDADGAADLVAATLGTDRLELAPGDGSGRFGALRSVHLDGTITAFAAGEAWVGSAAGGTCWRVAVTVRIMATTMRTWPRFVSSLRPANLRARARRSSMVPR